MEGPALAPTEAQRSWQQAQGPGTTLLTALAHLPPLHGPPPSSYWEAGITITPRDRLSRGSEPWPTAHSYSGQSWEENRNLQGTHPGLCLQQLVS